jgi:glyoxylase I family protein
VVTFSRIAHISIVVRDMATSTGWYQRVLGFELAGGVRPGPAGLGRPRQSLVHADSGFALTLQEPERRSGDLFDPFRTGLDHFSLIVDGEAGLDEWVARLDELGVPHSAVHDTGYSRFITLADPDGIAWELWVPTAQALSRGGGHAAARHAPAAAADRDLGGARSPVPITRLRQHSHFPFLLNGPWCLPYRPRLRRHRGARVLDKAPAKRPGGPGVGSPRDARPTSG